MVLVAYRTLEAQPATGEHQCPKFIFLRGVQIGDGTFIAGEIKISLINLHLKLVGFEVSPIAVKHVCSYIIIPSNSGSGN